MRNEGQLNSVCVSLSLYLLLISPSLCVMPQFTTTFWCLAAGTHSSSGPTLSTRRRCPRAWPSAVARSSRWWTRCTTASWATGWPSAWAKTTSCWRKASFPIRAGGLGVNTNSLKYFVFTQQDDESEGENISISH